MPISVACPRCQHLLRILAEASDRDVKCPECQHVFMVRGNTDITARDPLPVGAAPPGAMQPGPPPRLESRYDDDIRDDDIDIRDLGEKGGIFRSASGLALATRIMFVVNLLVGLAILGSAYLGYRIN